MPTLETLMGHTDGGILCTPEHDGLEHDVKTFHGDFRLTTLDGADDSPLECLPLTERADLKESE
jgi:hypothetical protein